MWWIIVLGLGIFFVPLILGRRNERMIWRDWELLLTPDGEPLPTPDTETELAELRSGRRKQRP